MRKVDNPEEVTSYWRADKGGGAKAYDLLIITTTALAPYFQPLKDHHDANGDGYLSEAEAPLAGKPPKPPPFIRTPPSSPITSPTISTIVLIGGIVISKSSLIEI